MKVTLRYRSGPLVRLGNGMATNTKCEHCDGTGADFIYNGHRFCCECMSELCSWFLDGGVGENPEQFAYAVETEEKI